MTKFKSAALSAALGVLLVSSTDSLKAAPDNTLGMALMSATVEENATLVTGSGGATVSQISPGRIKVTFDRDLAACTCTATFGAKNGGIFSSQPSYISANCPFGDNNAVQVYTLQNGSFLNAPFQLIGFCPK